MLSTQSMSAKTDPLEPAIARAIGHPVRPTRPRSWTRIIWAYLLGATVLTTLIAVDVDTATAAVAAGGVMVLMFGWFARLESLFLMLILVLPFDGLKFAQVLSLSNALVLLIVIKGTVQIASGRRRLHRSAIYLPLFLFAAAVVASCVDAEDPAMSWRLSLTLFGDLGVMVAALNILDDVESLYRAVVAVLIASVYVAVVGLSQVAVWLLTGQQVLGLEVYVLLDSLLPAPHLTSVFESEAILGIYLICGTVCALTFALAPRQIEGGRRFRLSAALLLAASLLTFSRALILAYAVGLPLVLSAAKRRLSRRLRRWVIMVAALVVLVVGWGTFQLVNKWNPGSTFTRLALLRGGIAHAAEHPFFGKGLAAHIVPMEWDVAEIVAGVSRDVDDSGGRDGHNTYLTLLVDTGSVGLLSFCWLLWAVWREGPGRPRMVGDDGRRTLLKRGLAGAYVLTVVGIAFNSVMGVKAVWLVFGLAAAVGRMAHAQPRRLAGAGAVRAENADSPDQPILSSRSGGRHAS